MRIKKIICLLLAGIMMMPLLSACGGDNTDNNDTEGESKEPTDEIQKIPQVTVLLIRKVRIPIS